MLAVLHGCCLSCKRKGFGKTIHWQFLILSVERLNCLFVFDLEVIRFINWSKFESWFDTKMNLAPSSFVADLMLRRRKVLLPPAWKPPPGSSSAAIFTVYSPQPPPDLIQSSAAKKKRNDRDRGGLPAGWAWYEFLIINLISSLLMEIL